MKLAHYYHVLAVPGWEKIVEEHLDALEESGLAVELQRLHLGVIGDPLLRKEVIAYCKSRITTVVTTEADEGWEQLTLNALWFDSVCFDAVLYAHTKGITTPSPWNNAWRRSMTREMVGGWKQCVEALSRYEIVASYWLTPEEWPDWVEHYAYPGGNFWWCRSDRIKSLDLPSTLTRHDAEVWIGAGGGVKARSLHPGEWPGWKNVGIPQP